MIYTADLHIHSHYAQATSKFLDLESIYRWARIKGINVIGTGDFTHPAWFAELRQKLRSDGSGLFRMIDPPGDEEGFRTHNIDVRFCLTTEISCEYFYNGKMRRHHHLVYARDFETVEKISKRISGMCDLSADGRPTINLPSRNLLEIVLESSDNAFLVPAHIWTPWFSILGSKGGCDSVEECFQDLTPHIFALETSLSADPAMSRQWSKLDRYTLMSNSDAHSQQNIGREVNRFDTVLNYDAMFEAVKTKKGFLGTYEFFPEEGKYHHDGHRKCNTSLSPARTAENKGLCPVCGKPVTIGVLNRVGQLSDRLAPLMPPDDPPFEYIVALPEILAEINGVTSESKRVQQAFGKTISAFGNEMDLMMHTPIEDIQHRNPMLAKAIDRLRKKEVTRIPGYDGHYGIIKFFSEKELGKKSNPQISMF